MKRSPIGVFNGNWKNRWRDELLVGDLPARTNWGMRLRNAVHALTMLDPRWMLWVDNEVNLRWTVERQTRLIEARVRALILKDYGFLGRQDIGSLIFSDSLTIKEDGGLRQS